jgi:hypothetical protein
MGVPVFPLGLKTAASLGTVFSINKSLARVRNVSLERNGKPVRISKAGSCQLTFASLKIAW